MDNIWILVVIVGAVISIVQKTQEKRRATEEKAEPSHDELERRIRELLGEEKGSDAPNSSAPQHKPVMTAKSASRPEYSPTKANRTSVQQSRHKSEGHNVMRTKATNTPNNGERSTSVAPKNQQMAVSTNANNAEGNQIEHIIEDFTMEKAVIYSEILKPKFEEL
ncbi:MAG: hypothetical protein IKY82_02110 [Alistipes sp.]|nr:hypothetical protein [Alistipes sp.]